MNSERVMAVVRLLVPLALTLLTTLGINLDANAVMVGVLIVCSIVSFVWSWWKNNNLSDAAIEAQKYLEELKNVEINKAE